MKRLTLGITWLTFTAFRLGQGLDCNFPGVWTNCTSLSYAEGAQYGDCLRECKNDNTCTHFTFLTNEKKDSCLLYTGCVDIDEDLCKKCISGERECPVPEAPECNQPQCCLDEPSNYLQDIKDEAQCLESCYRAGIADCRYYTYIIGSETCLHFQASCTSSHPSSDCFSGDRDCLSLPPAICDGNFCCAEKEIDKFEHADQQTCHQKCAYSQSETYPCKWFSLDLDTNICYHYSECDERTEQNCITGESRCPL